MDHRKGAVCGGEGEIDQTESVGDCHCGETSGGVGGGVHVADDCVGEVGEGVGEGTDGYVGGGGGGRVEFGEVCWRRSVVSVVRVR